MSGADLSVWRQVIVNDRHGEWRFRDDRHCRDLLPDHFFPLDPGGRRPKGMSEGARTAAAKAVCDGDGGPECPVRDQCREYAVNEPSLCGVWGGTTESERIQIRKARKAIIEARRDEADAGQKGAAA